MRRFVTYGPAFVVLLTALALLIGAPAIVLRVAHAGTMVRVSLARQTLDNDDLLERLNAALTSIASAVEPSIVHLDVRTRTGGRISGSTGAGWVFDDQGHIVTNAHVVSDASSVLVQFSDGRSRPADVVGFDRFTDIAVVRVNSRDGLVPARRASGRRLAKGERVFAFGSPFGFKFSMTEGIVSGLGRAPQTAAEFGGYTNYIQTDAAVNPGNSGGPIVDIHGRVVGMAVAIATGRDHGGTANDGQSAGIGFAIPLNTIESVVEQLVDTGFVGRGFLGIQYSGGRVQSIERDGQFRGVGIPVTLVVAQGPAESAGLQRGDIITRIDGQPITSTDLLRSIISSFMPGQLVSVEVWRDADLLSLDVALGAMPEEELARQALGEYGMSVDRDTQGRPVVSTALPGSPAFEAGFRRGQIILSVEDQGVPDAESALQAMYRQTFKRGNGVRVRISEPGADAPRDLRIILRR